MMKKLLAILMVLMLFTPVLLAACGQNAEPAESDTKKPAADETAAGESDTDAGPNAETEPGHETENTTDNYKDMQLLLVTDVHLCHLNWYGMTSEDRMAKMVRDLNDYYRKSPYEAILFLGDYSLDFWETGILGSWRHQNLSNTDILLHDYLPDLDCRNRYIIPGNHEQYGYDLWKEITGFERQYYIKLGGYLIFMLDNFHGDLDPDTDNHGVYTPTDLEFIRDVMDENPDMPVLLCAHYFDLAQEAAAGDGFRRLVCDDRVVALFCGHDHVRTVQNLGADYANKIIFHCGQFSYTKATITQCPWGWRSMDLSRDGITVTYFAPESTLTDGGKTIHIDEGYLEEIFVPNLLTNPQPQSGKETDARPETPDLSGLENLCRNATIVSASPGNKEKNGPASLIDGDTALTKWCVTSDPNLPADLSGKALYYATLDLGETRPLKAYRLFNASGSSYAGDSGNAGMDTKAWKLQSSADGVTWTDLDSVSQNTAPLYASALEGQARYVRLLILPGGANQNDDVVRIYELEIYG